MSRYDLDGRVAIVTGASAGLGEQFCHGFAASGANVVLAARREELLEQVAAAVRAEHGVEALVVRTDVARERDVVRLVETAARELGRVDVLVNNAGNLIAKPLLEQTLDDWSSVIDTNLTATFLASREAARFMVPRKSGSIINISSIFAFGAAAQFQEVGYYAAKGGIVSLTKALAVELGKANVRVNAIAPGFFPTPIATGVTDEVRKELIWPRTALPYTAENEMIRGAACFLASDDARFVTGETLVVDGGHLAH